MSYEEQTNRYRRRRQKLAKPEDLSNSHSTPLIPLHFHSMHQSQSHPFNVISALLSTPRTIFLRSTPPGYLGVLGRAGKSMARDELCQDIRCRSQTVHHVSVMRRASAGAHKGKTIGTISRSQYRSPKKSRGRFSRMCEVRLRAIQEIQC